MASPQAQAVKNLLRQFAESVSISEPSVEALKAGADSMGQMTAEPAGAVSRAVDAGGVPALWVEPEGEKATEVILYAHGGAYVGGSAESHRKLAGHLAIATGRRVLSVDYRLAPAHSYPAQNDDIATAYAWLRAEGVAPGSVVFAGDSAGGGLVASAALKLRDSGNPTPAAVVLFSALLDLTGTGESWQTRAEVDLALSEASFALFTDAYLQGADPRDPYVSPLLGDLSGFPPVYLIVGDEERLLDDSTRFAEKAKAADVDATIDVFPEMMHVFVASAGNVPEADDAIQRVAQWLEKLPGNGD